MENNFNYMCHAKKGQILTIPKGSKIKLAFYRTPIRHPMNLVCITDILTDDYHFYNDAYFVIINVFE